MNKERLLEIADFLEALPPHKFGFSTFVTVGDKSPADALASPVEHCGTTACALGWLPAIFPQSFEWKSNYFDTMPFMIGGTLSLEAEIKFFLGITSDQYYFLFMPEASSLHADASACEVAQQIREFVATDGNEHARVGGYMDLGIAVSLDSRQR